MRLHHDDYFFPVRRDFVAHSGVRDSGHSANENVPEIHKQKKNLIPKGQKYLPHGNFTSKFCVNTYRILLTINEIINEK